MAKRDRMATVVRRGSVARAAPLFLTCVVFGAIASNAGGGCGGDGTESGAPSTSGAGGSGGTAASASGSGTGMSGTTVTSTSNSGVGGASNASGAGGATAASSSATSASGSSGVGGAGGTASSVASSSASSATSASSSANASTSGAGGSAPPTIVKCLNQVYECGDTLDNDNDGLIDSQDPDCLGACDNTEGSYFGGIAGQPGPPCTVDCYFDADSGSGNDGCYWNHKCDPHEIPPGYHPESDNGAMCAYDPSAMTAGTLASCAELYSTQSAACLSYCGPLTPNGCDCFGCCELPAMSGKYVFLGSTEGGIDKGTCTPATVGDPTKCQPCEPVAGCLNDCKTCELCIGKPTLPASCFSDGGTGQQCPPNIQPCGLPNQPACPSTEFCITGCCQPHL